MSKIIDFDKYIKERKRVSPQFTLFDTTYTLPPTMPYTAMLYIQSLASDDPTSKIKDDDILYFIKILFNDEAIIETWKSHSDFDIDLIETLTSWILEAYSSNDPKGKMTLMQSQEA